MSSHIICRILCYPSTVQFKCFLYFPGNHGDAGLLISAWAAPLLLFGQLHSFGDRFLSFSVHWALEKLYSVPFKDLACPSHRESHLPKPDLRKQFPQHLILQNSNLLSLYFLIGGPQLDSFLPGTSEQSSPTGGSHCAHSLWASPLKALSSGH